MFCVLTYGGAIVAANLTASTLGPSVTPVIGFTMIGLDLTLRDKLHDRWSGRHLWLRMFTLIAGAGTISYLLNPASSQIATASVTAFCVSSAVDALAYQSLKHKPWVVRANGSNAAGSAADSILFPMIAFGAFLPEIVALQFAAKLAGGALWSGIIARLNKTHLNLRRVAA